MKTKRDYRSFDIFLALLTLGLCIFGLIIIPSAGIGIGIPAENFIMQKVWVITGFFIMLAAAFINYEFICKFFVPIYMLNIFLLVATIALKRYLGADVWRELGIVNANGEVSSVSIMPSEFAKIFMIISISAFIDKYEEKINNILVVMVIVVATALPVLLIIMQPSLSASLVLVFITIMMLFVAKLSYKYFIIALLIIVPAGAFFIYDLNSDPHILIDKIFMPYQIEGRIRPFLDPASDPDALYQTTQSQMAISSGQLYGNGLYNNRIHVPESTNDYIFAIIASEFGFFGSMAVIATAFLIVLRCLMAAWRSETFLGRLIASGVSSMFAFHIFVNVGVATGLLPVTGITFPFISSGGSSIWISMACVGLVINVGMTKPKSMFDDYL